LAVRAPGERIERAKAVDMAGASKVAAESDPCEAALCTRHTSPELPSASAIFSPARAA